MLGGRCSKRWRIGMCNRVTQAPESTPPAYLLLTASNEQQVVAKAANATPANNNTVAAVKALVDQLDTSENTKQRRNEKTKYLNSNLN